MSFDISNLNIWAILVATIISMVIGSVWYSPILFGNVWMKLIKKKKEELTSPAGPLIGTVIIALINNILLSLLLYWTNAQTLGEGLTVSALLALIVITTTTVNYLFESRPMKLMAIQAGFHVIVFLVNSVVLTMWK